MGELIHKPANQVEKHRPLNSQTDIDIAKGIIWKAIHIEFQDKFDSFIMDFGPLHRLIEEVPTAYTGVNNGIFRVRRLIEISTLLHKGGQVWIDGEVIISLTDMPGNAMYGDCDLFRLRDRLHSFVHSCRLEGAETKSIPSYLKRALKGD